jgi:transcriptional regulator with XRE-family HTH domain
MIAFTDGIAALEQLGHRLRRERLARDETMARFAARIGVSVPTLRAAEEGRPTVQVGVWINALWALDRLEELEALLRPAPGGGLIERAMAQRAAAKGRRPLERQRARRRPRMAS